MSKIDPEADTECCDPDTRVLAWDERRCPGHAVLRVSSANTAGLTQEEAKIEFVRYES